MLFRSLLPLASSLAGAYAISVDTGSLRANGAVNPIAVDTNEPRLTWRLQSDKRGDAQKAYQIQAASSAGDWSKPDLWDTGKVNAGDTFATYSGKELSSRSSVHWRVKVWDVDGQASDWSSTSTFEISLLDTSDWEADWIANGQYVYGESSLPLFAKEFDVACPVAKARLYLLGLGLHAPELNGNLIGNNVMMEGYSTINKTLLYSTYDVTNQVEQGENVIGIALGKGIYDAEKPLLGRYFKFSLPEPAQMKLIAQLEYTCESGKTIKVLSDDSWVTTGDGPHIEGSWFGGEEYDARKEIPHWSKKSGDRSSWSKAVVTTGPPGKLVSPRSPPLKITENVKPVKVTKVGSQWVYDMGVNYAGWYSFKMKGKGRAGTRITFWPSEKVNAAGAPDQSTTGTPIFDAYTLSGADEETYQLKWTYHGGQFIAVNTTWEPSLEDMTGHVVRSSNEVVLEHSSSKELFNGIHEIIDRSIKGNMYSVLTDCPHREKLGWIEQDHFVFEPLNLGYDLQAYGDDLIRTMADAQAADVPGLIPDIAPEYGRPMGGGYRNDPNWGNAMIIVPLQLYQYYGDRRILEIKHKEMIEYINYLINRAGGKPYLNDGGLGDWEGLDLTTPKGATGTFGYHQAALALYQVEDILGNKADATKYRELADSIAQGFHSMWYNTTGGFAHYCQNSQGCNALALDMGAVPVRNRTAVLTALIDSLAKNDWHVTVGEISLPSLFRVLKKARREDVLYNIMSSETMPSYGFQVVYGATSLWEHWDAPKTGGSLNHFMYGYGDLWLLQLAGLEQAKDSIAWNSIDYIPNVIGDLTSARTSYRSPRGLVSASWKLEGKKLKYDIVVPVGSTGTVYLNATDITEGGKAPKAGENGVTSIRGRKGCARTLIGVGSGKYSFEATMR